jgi:hypothetical protein
VAYEDVMRTLAQGATGAHKGLREVVFLKKNKDALLVFSDGAVIPTSFEERGDERWQAIANEVNAFPYFEEAANKIGGTDPLSMLAFGYSGTGPNCFATFLGAAGFSATNVEDINPPLRLRKDGSTVQGTKRGETIEWEDGSATPAPRGGKKKGLRFWK